MLHRTVNHVSVVKNIQILKYAMLTNCVYLYASCFFVTQFENLYKYCCHLVQIMFDQVMSFSHTHAYTVDYALFMTD